ncbi:hypothetical protein P7C70_g1620, partial [Phenoliferia sp. Uapishka_3]
MPPRAKRAVKRAIEDDYEEDDEPAGEEADYEPPAKKAMTKKATAAKGKGRRAKLELFTNLPLDVVTDVRPRPRTVRFYVLTCHWIQICHMLDPPTLLALTKTSRVLRHVVTGPNSAAIWESAFDSIDLLRPKATDITPWAITRTLECVPHSLYFEMIYYWAPTVAHISSILYDLESKQKKDPSKAVFDAFVAEAKENATRAISDGNALQRWEDGEANRRARKNDEIKRIRKQKIEAKMIELGFDYNDFEYSQEWHESPHINHAKELTDRSELHLILPVLTMSSLLIRNQSAVWENIKPHLVKIVEDCREEERAATARRAEYHARLARRHSLDPFYQALRESCPTDLRHIFLPFEVFSDLVSVTAIWKPEPPDKEEDVPDPHSPEILLPLYSTAIFTEIRSNFKQLEIKVFASLAKAYAEPITLSNNVAENYKNAPLRSSNDMLSLSRSITSSVKCTRCKVLLPFPAIIPHIYSSEKEVHGLFSPAMSLNEGTITTSANQIHCIRVFLEQLQLSEDTTSVEDLNAMGKCFGCDDCPGKAAQQVEAGGKEVSLEKLMWYELVAHSPSGHSGRRGATPIYTPPKIIVFPLAKDKLGGSNRAPTLKEEVKVDEK